MERMSTIGKPLVVVAMLAVMMASAVGCHRFFDRHFGGYYDRYRDR